MNVPTPINILVVGECGSGKSSLIDGLRDKDAKAAPQVGKDATGVTKEITVYQCPPSSDGVQINLVDTPGVGDHDITPMTLSSLIEAALTKGAVGEGGISGVVVTTPIPSGRINLGLQVAQTLVEHGFLCSGEGSDKWAGIILCGTKLDRAEPDDVKHFTEGIDGMPSLSTVFYQNAARPGQTVMVSRGHYDQLIHAIKQLPAACISYQWPSVQDMDDALGASLIRPWRLQTRAKMLKIQLGQTAKETGSACSPSGQSRNSPQWILGQDPEVLSGNRVVAAEEAVNVQRSGEDAPVEEALRVRDSDDLLRFLRRKRTELLILRNLPNHEDPKVIVRTLLKGAPDCLLLGFDIYADVARRLLGGGEIKVVIFWEKATNPSSAAVPVPEEVVKRFIEAFVAELRQQQRQPGTFGQYFVAFLSVKAKLEAADCSQERWYERCEYLTLNSDDGGPALLQGSSAASSPGPSSKPAIADPSVRPLPPQPAATSTGATSASSAAERTVQLLDNKDKLVLELIVPFVLSISQLHRRVLEQLLGRGDLTARQQIYFRSFEEGLLRQDDPVPAGPLEVVTYEEDFPCMSDVSFEEKVSPEFSAAAVVMPEVTTQEATATAEVAMAAPTPAAAAAPQPPELTQRCDHGIKHLPSVGGLQFSPLRQQCSARQPVLEHFLRRMKFLPSVKGLQISASDLVKILHCAGGVQLTVPIQTWKEAARFGFNVDIVAACELLPRGAKLQSQVIRLGPHGQRFPVPVRVTIPLFEITCCLGSGRALRVVVLEHEKGERMWKEVRQCRFEQHRVHVFMDEFCDLGVIEVDAEEVEVGYYAYIAPKPKMDGSHKGKIAIVRQDCPHCQKQWKSVQEHWMSTEQYVCGDSETTPEEHLLEPGARISITADGDAIEPPRDVQIKWCNTIHPVRLKFPAHGVVYYTLLDVDPPHHQQVQLCLERSHLPAQQDPHEPARPQRRSPVKTTALWAATTRHHPPLDMQDVQGFAEIQNVEAKELNYATDIVEALRENSPECLIFAGHNDGALLLQCDELAHESLAELLQRHATDSAQGPRCILLAVCHGESLARRLIDVDGVEMVIFWHTHSGFGVPDKVAAFHTQLFVEQLLQVQEDDPGRYQTVFEASREALRTRFEGEMRRRGENFRSIVFWVDPAYPGGALLGCLTKNGVVLTAAQAPQPDLAPIAGLALEAPISSPASSTEQV